MRTVRRFTEQEDAILREDGGRSTSVALARVLGRDPSSIVARRVTLGLHTPNRRIARFTDAEDLRLRELVGSTSLERIAAILGKSRSGVLGRARRLDIPVPRRPIDARKRPVRRERWQRNGHRAVVERILGRPLAATEVVHHINMDGRDNRPENLHLFSTGSAHGRAHGSLNRVVARLLADGVIRFDADRGTYELCASGK